MHTYATTKEMKKKAFIVKCQNIKQPIGIQLTFMLEIKIEKYIFRQNMTMFLVADMSFLNQCYDVNVHTYATTKELKSKAFTANCQNIK